MSGRIRLALKLGLSAGLLGLILYAVPLSDIVVNLRSVRLWPALAGFALLPGIFYLTAVQTSVLAGQQDMKLPTVRIFWINFITSFYGLFLPGPIAGGAIRWYKYARVENKPLEAAATLAFARLLNVLVAVALGGLCWSLDVTARGHVEIGAALGVVLVVLAFTYWLFFHQVHASQFAASFEASVRLPTVVRTTVPRMLRAAAAFRGLPASKLVSVLWVLLLSHLLGIASYVLFAHALGIEISAISLGWIRTAVVLITLMPVSIAGFGIREGGLIYMLHVYDVSPALAVALSFLLFARRLLAGVIGAVCEGFDLLRQRGRSPVRG